MSHLWPCRSFRRVALLWRRLPKRELILGVLVVLVLAYFGWRIYRTQVEIFMTNACNTAGGGYHFEPMEPLGCVEVADDDAGLCIQECGRIGRMSS